jgi:hypothetical protein
MTQRLPTPGGDSGDWGTILNGFLEVSHNSDGTLIPTAVTDAGAYSKPSGGIPASDLDSSTQTIINSVANKYVKPVGGIPYTDLAGSIPVSYLTTTGTASSSTYLRGDGTWSAVSSASNATGSTPGLVQLSGDLGGGASGTAASPQVTSTHLASALPLAQGGTGSTTQNFVDLSTSQTIAGTKTFSSTITGNISGNAATATNANTVTTIPALTGDVTSNGSGNVTTVAKINGITLPSNAPTSSGQVLTTTGSGSGTGTSWQTVQTGSSTLSGDSDVSITNPVDGQRLIYSASAGRWINDTASVLAWAANTSYYSGQLALSPAGQYLPGITSLVQANSNFTSTMFFNASNWTRLADIDTQQGINASDYGWHGWTMDPVTAFQAVQLNASGRTFLLRFRSLVSSALTNIAFNVTLAGSGLTTGENFVGIYDTGQTTAGFATLLGYSVDQTTTFETAGNYSIPITAQSAGSLNLLAGQDYFLALLSVGTTLPKFAGGPNIDQGSPLANTGLSGLSGRLGVASGPYTTLPTTIAAASINTANGGNSPICLIAL